MKYNYYIYVKFCYYVVKIKYYYLLLLLWFGKLYLIILLKNRRIILHIKNQNWFDKIGSVGNFFYYICFNSIRIHLDPCF